MRPRLPIVLACAALLAAPALLHAQPASSSQPRADRGIRIGGYATVGRVTFDAGQSFTAIVGDDAGTLVGGGGRVGLPWGGLFVDVGAWHFAGEGERVFIAGGQPIPLGIPVEVEVTPLEISGGWQFRFARVPRLLPYVAGGYTSLRYREHSQFDTPSESVDERFNGYHVLGGAEFRLTRWLGVAGEAHWSSVPDAIGEAGVSASYGEDNLGGTTLRFKITVGR